MSVRKTDRLVRVSSRPNSASSQRTKKQSVQKLLQSTVESAVETLEGRVMLAATPLKLGVHFAQGQGGNFPIAATDSAGVVPIKNWNNEMAATGAATGLNDFSGTATGVGVQWMANGVWDAATQENMTDAFPNPSGDFQLMASYLDNFTGTAVGTNASLTSGTLDGNGILLTGLSSSTAYDIYVYSLQAVFGRNSNISVIGANTSTQPITTPGAPVSTYIAGANGDYLLFSAVQPSPNGNILIEGDGQTFRTPFEGVEVIESVTQTTAPAAPQNLTATLNANGVSTDLAWDENATDLASNNDDGFLVKRGTSMTGPFTTIANLTAAPGGHNTYNDPTIHAGQNYFYEVVAFNHFNGHSESPPSNVAGPVMVTATSTPMDIGVNFGADRTDATTMAPFALAQTDTAGVVPISHWNNASGAAGTASILHDLTGTNTTVGVTWKTNDTWDATIEDGTDQFTGADHTLMAGYLDNNGGTAAATTNSFNTGSLDGNGVLISGLPAGQAYDVYIYSLASVQGRGGPITLTGFAPGTQTAIAMISTTYVQATGPTNIGNYVKFASVAPINGDLLITPDPNSFRVSFQGVELVPVASASHAPAAPTNLTAAANGAFVNLSWTDNADNEGGYEILRGTSPTGPFSVIGNTGPISGTGGTGTFTDQDSINNNALQIGHNYSYEVEAWNSFMGGTLSAPAGPANVTFGTPGPGAEMHIYAQGFWSGDPKFNVIVPTIDFNWGNGMPDPSIQNFSNADVFTGKVKADTTGAYTFFTNTDDDGFLWVNGVLVSEDGGGHGQRDATDVFPLNLTGGQTYDFVFMQSNGGGGAGAHLEWIAPGNATGTPTLVPGKDLSSLSDQPLAPTGLAVSGTPNANQVSFTYTPGSSAANPANNAVVFYLLQRRVTGSGGPWATISRSDSGFTNVNDASPSAGTSYDYRVVSWNYDTTNLDANASNVVTVAVPAHTTTETGGAEAHFYNADRATSTLGQDPHNFAVDGTLQPVEFQTLTTIDNAGADVSPDIAQATDPVSKIVGPNFIHREEFASIFTGKILTDAAGKYTFITNSDDDGYLFINDQLVSQDPGAHGQEDATKLTPITLAAHTAYNFVFIHQQITGGWGFHLSWIEPGQTTESVVPAATGTAGGLQEFMDVPHQQSIDASGNVTDTATGSAAGTLTLAAGGKLSWTDQSFSELWFEVQRSTDGGTTWTDIGNAGMDQTGFTDPSPVAGGIYRVRGVNFDGAGPVSNTVGGGGANDTITGTSGNDAITLKQDADGTDIDWTLNGGPVNKVAITDPNGLTINGNGGTDTITLDNSNGDPTPKQLVLNQTGAGSKFILIGLNLPSSAGHKMDIENSTVQINYPGSTILPAVQSALAGGQIFSSTLASNPKFAIADDDSADPLNAGQPANTILLRPAIIGNATLSGKVGFGDLVQLARNYGKSNADWAMGDFNYDGKVGFDDLVPLARNYNQSGPAATAAATLSASIIQADDGLGKKKLSSRRH